MKNRFYTQPTKKVPMFIKDTHVKTPLRYIVSQLLKNGLLLTVSKLH